MSGQVDYHCRAEALLSQAATAANMVERGRLIDEAMYWHMLALEAAEDGDGGVARDEPDEDEILGPPS
jgi:hypothetical protein